MVQIAFHQTLHKLSYDNTENQCEESETIHFKNMGRRENYQRIYLNPQAN